MKHLILVFALFLGLMPLAGAQEANTTKDISQEDYERMLDNQLKVEFRNNAYKSMGLNEEEIIAFDPLYNEYVAQKREILKQKFDLIDKYREEMNEDDSAKDEEEETSGFIENYWELDIKEMELKKDFFDRFEEVSSTDQVINFFLLEEDMTRRFERPSIIRIVPMIIEFDRMPSSDPNHMQKDKMHDQEGMKKDKDKEGMEKKEGAGKEGDDAAYNYDQTRKSDIDQQKSAVTTQEKEEWKDAKITTKTDPEMDKTDKSAWTEKSAATPKTDMETTKSTTTGATAGEDVKAYSKWVKESKGGVALNHQYTHDGLNHLAKAVWNVAEANGVEVSEWKSKKEKVMKIANDLQIDPLDTDHADWAREAFVMLADMIEVLQTKTNNAEARSVSQSVVTAAHDIDPDQLLTRQADKIYTFFERANDAVNKMSATAASKSSAAATQSNKQ